MFLPTSFASTCVHSFLGLEPWYQYLKSKIGPPPACDISGFNVVPGGSGPSDIPLILAAVIDDLLRIAGLVALVFVIIGAVKYITSQGNPENTANAQSTIINALIGMALAIVAISFVNFLGNKLGQ